MKLSQNIRFSLPFVGRFGAVLGLICLLISCHTNDVEGPPPKVSMSLDVAIASEEEGQAVLSIQLSNESTDQVQIFLSPSGTASIEEDYLLSDSEILIPAGSMTAEVQIAIVQDTIEEGNETLILEIEGVIGGQEEGAQEVSLTIEDDDVPVLLQLLLNEVLYDPWNSGLSGDANGDGSYAQKEDEFIELVNLSSQEADLSGFKIFDAENLAINSPNHTLPANTILPSGGVLVIFGGGNPTGDFGGAMVQTSTSGDMNLNNSGDILYLFDTEGNEILSFDIEPLSNNPNESYTRNPDLTGEFVQHSDATTGVLFSPGTKIDGTPF
ncbi:MAG: lamin tail domain-containing protein [Bacteroidota bacterium]